MDRLANLLNAAATAISDAQAMSMARHADLKPSTTGAILTLGQHSALTLSELARIIGLSHSATVRLIDGLADKGLARRGDGQDRREVAISLTIKGLRLYADLRKAQSEILIPLTEGLTPMERATLEVALSRILAALTKSRQSADHICRFCDEGVCGQDDCPVEVQAVALSRA
ncbi:MarR family winged helix-turn-helix transcriptional regulator [Roseovarius mucosus]|uniref:MarR family winged helix-turn-helix transcriptional regulator n=1 Tax=Roseovarius mucosus TaxID=215743 RepID=UPI003F6F157F